MAVIYVSAGQNESVFNHLIISSLQERHEVLQSHIEVGSGWKENIKSALIKADVVVVILTETYMHSKWGESELNTIISYTQNNKSKLFVPIIMGDFNLPYSLSDIQPINFERPTVDEVDGIIEQVERAIDLHFGRLIANVEVVEEKRIKFESTAAEYIEEALSELKDREKGLNNKAQFWYWMGYGAIAVGALSALVFAFINISSFGETSRWDLVIFSVIKNIVLIGLLLALAKYSFTLGKSFMDESLKNSDRIHAISFGKFYLQAFGNDATPEEVKDVFQHWNISSDNSFSGLNAEMIEPNILEAALNILKAAKPNSAKP